MTLTDPKIILTFQGNDLPAGHNTSQTVGACYIVNRSLGGKYQKMSGLKSSSDQIALQLARKTPCIEDLLVTEGNVQAVLKDGETTIFTGFVSTNYKWGVSQHGQEVLNITIEGVGTRLLQTPFIESGKHFFRCTAYQALYAIVHPLGISIRSGDNSKLSMKVSHEVDAGTTRRELVDQLLYECNCVYFFDANGKLCVDAINPSTTGATVIDKNSLYVKGDRAVQVSKSLRSYKGARVKYTVLYEAQNYLVYRNTTGQDQDHPYCNMQLGPGEYFDGAEIYSEQEWAAETADQFREPTLISAVNAASESSIVGSGKIVNISNLSPDVRKASDISVEFEAAGGPYFSLLAHNAAGGSAQNITRMDLYADIVYEKSQGIIRTQIDGTQEGKSLLEEELSWIHDKTNASKHANLLAQFYRYASATYQFYSTNDITLGSVIRLKENVFSGLDVYVLVTAKDLDSNSNIISYTGVGVSTFDLTEDAYHGETTSPSSDSKGQRGNTISTGLALWGESTCRGYEGLVGDLYLNTDNDNLYKCNTSGSSTTAVWQYIGNIRGKNGSMEGVTNVIQYAVSTSSTEFVFPDGVYGYRNGETEGEFGYADAAYGFQDHSWSGTVDDWYKGLYVWQRVATTVFVGYDNLNNPVYETTYSEPVYCKDITEGLEASCVFRLVPESECYLLNKARPGDADYKVNLIFTGYPPAYQDEPITDVVVKDVNGGTIADIEVEYSGAEITLTIPYKLAYDQINIIATGRFNETATCSMTSQDETEYDVFGGLFASDADAEDYFEANYGGMMEGYTYAINDSTSASHLALRTYSEADGGVWELLSESGFDPARISKICGRAQKSVLEMVQAGSVSMADYGYFNIIVANVITSDFIGSKQIEVQEDDNGNPGMIYGGAVTPTNPPGTRTTGKGFIFDSDGNGEVHSLVVKGQSVIEGDSLVKGSIQNINEDDGKTVFDTNKDSAAGYTMSASRTDGTDAPVAYAYAEWKACLQSFFSGLTANEYYFTSGADNYISGYWGRRGITTKNVNLVRRVTSVSSTRVRETQNSGGVGQDSSKTLYVNQDGKDITLREVGIIANKTADFWGTTDRGDTQIIVYKYDGTVYRDYGVNDDSDGTYYNVTVPIDGYIIAYWGKSTAHSWSTTAGSAYADYYESDNWSVGLWLTNSEGTGKVLGDLLPASGYGTVAQKLRANSTTLEIALTAAATWPSGVKKYYGFSWTSAPSDGQHTPSSVISTSYISSQSTFTYDGVSKTIIRVDFSTTYLKITDSNNTEYLLSSGYHPAYSLDIATLTAFLGARARNMMPVYENSQMIGEGNCGTSLEPWALVCGITVTQTSKRERKTNIEDYMGNALEILKGVKIKSFNFKAEVGKERCYKHYGFIADDTAEELSTPYHDVLETGNCIGILIKAVQELAAELDKLKETT